MKINTFLSGQTLIVLAILLLITLGSTAYLGQVKTELTKDNQMLTEDVSMLQETRDELMDDISNLQDDFDALLSSNDSLAILFEHKTNQVEAKDKEIKQIKKDFAKDAAGINDEIKQLRNIKKELNLIVGQLKSENEQLKISNANLTKSNVTLNNQLAASEAKNKELLLNISDLKQINGDLETEQSKLMAESTRAANILVDIRKKGDKPTSSARRAREIKVSFDVKSLPKDKLGEHNIYIVLSDVKGIPVKVLNPIEAAIKSNSAGQTQAIIAQQMIRANLFESDRLQFQITPVKGSLHKGYYRAVIYADWGLLGGAQFNLR